VLLLNCRALARAAHTVFRAGEVHGPITQSKKNPPLGGYAERAKVTGNLPSACAGPTGERCCEPIRRFSIRLRGETICVRQIVR
jgi:2-dehydropantoate 2-reductase